MNQTIKPYVACLAAALFSFYNLLSFSVFDALSTDMIAELHFTTSQMGLFSSAFLFSNGISLIAVGVLLDRYSLRKIALVLMVVAIIATYGLAHSSTFSACVFFRILQGFASAGSLLVATRTAVQWFPKRKAFVIGVIMAIALSGGIVGDNIANIIALDWRNMLTLNVFIGIIFISLMYVFLHENDCTNTHDELFELKKISRCLCDIKLILLGGYVGLMNFPVFILAGLWANNYLVNHFQLLSAQANFSASLIFLGVIVGGPIFGYLSDKVLSRKSVMLLGSLACLVSVGLLILFNYLTFRGINIIFFSLGVFSSTQIIAYAVVADMYPFVVLSLATAVVSLFENVLGGFGQSAFGFLLHFHGSFPGHYMAAMLLFPLAFLICFFIITRFNLNSFNC